MKRVYLDANVIFTAAHNPSGKASLLFELAWEGHWTLITSQIACEEARRNLCIKYPECLARLEDLLRNMRIISPIPRTACPLDLPLKDQPIFLGALQSGATYLLTGDVKHFGRFMERAPETEGVLIQTVSSFFLSILEE
ncbi:MAG: PIN domain-containing protein [Desulfovermiculus sp.]|nr:PIN domain-containing protein [Desulfovermiculus sp.]